MSTPDPVVIAWAVRTPLGRFQGELGALPAHALGAHAIKAAVEPAGVKADRIDEVIMGNVL
jgi:acetyl-CoA C-acetyltransferase